MFININEVPLIVTWHVDVILLGFTSLGLDTFWDFGRNQLDQGCWMVCKQSEHIAHYKTITLGALEVPGWSNSNTYFAYEPEVEGLSDG